jgi:methionyl-tRNA formyltransferase
MTRTLRIVFMGTPDFAVESLRILQNSAHELVGVVTAPDKPAGRGKKMRASAVKEYSLENELYILQPTNLKDEQFIAALQNLQPDLIVVVAFRMLPKVVWQLAPLGTINLHASLLPNYRGAAPINWAIVNGETKTGVTTFFINEEIDTGDLIAQREVEIGEQTTAGELHDMLMETGAQLLLETVNQIAENKVVPQPQIITGDSENLKSAPKISKEHLHIDWNRPAGEILNLIRGMSPYPAAFALNRFDGQPIKITLARAGADTLPPGKVRVTGKKILEVGTGTTTIEIQELQLAGKKRMDVVSFLNGFNPDALNQLY